MRTFRRLLLLFLLSLVYAVVSAQPAPQRIVINYPEVNESPEQQLLGLYFTVLNTEGAAIPDAQVESASIVLDNGAPAEVLDIRRPDTPLYITLVLDASGSMRNAAADMRAAAIEAVNNAPPNALFSIIQFNQEINVVQAFTQDRNLAINAVGTVDSVVNSGTCLYDATFQAVELLRNVPPPARRAVILFTDGRDEITLGQGDQCSTQNFDDVIDLAADEAQPVPIYTIGLRGDRNINENELRGFASSTGGLSQIGGQERLGELFQRIIDSLSGQLLVEAELCTEPGTRSATLIINTGRESLEPDVASFNLTTECLLPTPTPVPTATSTPQPLALFIESFAFSSVDESMRFEVRRQGDGAINQLRVQVNDASTNALQTEEFITPSEGAFTVIEINTGSLPGGEIEIVVTALDEANGVLAQERGEFGVIRPTATPTATPLPVEITFDSVEYNAAEDQLLITLEIVGEDRIEDLELRIIDADTNLQQGTYSPDITEQITLPMAGLSPGQEYIVRLLAEGVGGQNIQQESEFTYTPLITPTPVVSAAIETLNVDEESDEFIVVIETENQASIAEYRVRIVNSETGILVTERTTVTLPEDDQLRLPIGDLDAGEYTITLLALDENGETISSSSIEASWTPPPTPTPTPLPTTLEQLQTSARENPTIVAAIAGVAILLLVVFVWLIRRGGGKSNDEWSAALPGQTGVMEALKQPTSSTPGAASAAADDDKTEVLSAVSSDQAPASLLVTKTNNAEMLNKRVTIASPFTIGRSNASLTFQGDKSISRTHATINFENGNYFIVDNDSSNGTFVDGTELKPMQDHMLKNGATIRLGQTTELKFELMDDSTQVFESIK